MEAVMATHYLRLREVCVRLGVDDSLLREVCEEGLVEVRQTPDHEGEISADDAERLRLITVLIRDLDVNLAGAEVILHMRDDLRAMQLQFDEILHGLVEELRRRLPR
jgi:MerR family transcriptional regulator/heat shock protein HspR